MRRIARAAALVIGLLATPALAQAPTIQAKDAWARATASTAKVGGVFMTLTATGAPDKVVSAASPVAEKVELHETVQDGTVMRMRPVVTLDVAPGTPTVLKPGSYHVMLIDLKKPLAKGEIVPITLQVEGRDKKIETVEVKAEVRELTAGAAPAMQHKH